MPAVNWRAMRPRPPPTTIVTSVTPRSVGAGDDLVLKVTPPRAPRHLVTRSRLLASDEQFRDRLVVLVQAPPGFGKTSLLAQWRLEHLSQGSVVAWLSAQKRDDPQRLLQALALAVRKGAGRPTFGHTLLEPTASTGLEGITEWLAEVTRLALNVVLIVDEADTLPAASRDALAYTLRNAPPNLRAVIAARTNCHFELDDLVDYGQCVIVGAAKLRFDLDEAIVLLHTRFGTGIDNNTCAIVHELTEGWPLGLQLALSVAADGPNASALVAAMAARGGSLREHFVDLLLSNLDPADVAFLTRISVLDDLHPDLCRALSRSDDAAQRLARMARDTPMFITSETGDWLRMHMLARDVLRQRFGDLPAAEQADMHAAAATWLADHGLLEAAAAHAFSAGQQGRAYELAERCLYESLSTRGRPGVVLEWLERLPSAELEHRPRLLLAAAWALALSDRNDEAGRLVAKILTQPGSDDALRCECALIQSGAAIFADDPDRFAELHDLWGEAPPLRDPLLLRVHANRTALRSLLAGEPALARRHLQHAPRAAEGSTLGYVNRWSEFFTGMSYLWEGQVLLAEQLLRPALALAEADLGRRNPFATMQASLLAAALWERDQPAQAAALLANRLDVLERTGLPETLLLGYRTLARIAVAEGAENRALELLGALEAAGVARRLPRLRIASLADQARLHAHRFRPETCRDLCVRIDALLADPALPQGRLWRRSVAALADLAQGYAAIAAQDWRNAIQALTRADAMAQSLKLGRLHIELLGLRAFALDRCGEKSLGLLREAADLAATYGLTRVFDDAHPALGDWARQALAGTMSGAADLRHAAAPFRTPPPAAAPRPGARSTPSMALTPKEREVLELLARNLSNKEMGLALQVSETTIKWHVKNLFAKLDGGTRKQVVQRARILGLLESA